MEGFWSSVSSWWSEKTSSPLYFTYFGFLLVWNWSFFQIIFLENENLFFSPRVEYIHSHLFFSIPLLEDVTFWISTPLTWLANFTWHLVPPIIFTYLAIVFLPRLHAWAFNIHVKSYFARKDAWRNANLEYERGETTRLKKEFVEKQQQQVQKKAIEKTLTEKERWENEYNEFEKHPLFSKFKQILISVHKNKGYMGDSHLDIKGVAHAKNLIVYTKEKETGLLGERIELTEKGKFFADKYLEKSPLTPEMPQSREEVSWEEEARLTQNREKK